MEICNDDIALILWLWHLIQLLLSGIDPWQIWFDITQMIETCGRTGAP